MKKYLNPYLTAQPEPLVHNENFPAHNISARVIASPESSRSVRPEIASTGFHAPPAAPQQINFLYLSGLTIGLPFTTFV